MLEPVVKLAKKIGAWALLPLMLCVLLTQASASAVAGGDAEGDGVVRGLGGCERIFVSARNFTAVEGCYERSIRYAPLGQSLFTSEPQGDVVNGKTFGILSAPRVRASAVLYNT